MRGFVRALKPLRCELCGGPMRLVRRLPATGDGPNMAVYQCERCQHTLVKAIEEDTERV
jgi:hypothetical protein